MGDFHLPIPGSSANPYHLEKGGHFCRQGRWMPKNQGRGLPRDGWMPSRRLIPRQHSHCRIMARYAADTAATPGSSPREMDTRMIGFNAPELLVRPTRIVIHERKIQVAMEDVATRQGKIRLQIKGRFHFNRQRTIAAWGKDGFERIQQILFRLAMALSVARALASTGSASKSLAGV